MTIEVLVSLFDAPLSDDRLRALLATLPVPLREKIGRYRRWQDRQAVLLSRLLLRRGLIRAGLGPDCLDAIVEDANGRPGLPCSAVDFNLSHSARQGGAAACAVSRAGRVGVDVERIRPIAVEDFRRWLTKEDWQIIESAEDPHRAFFTVWTIKESALKADGRGISVMERAQINDNHVVLDGVRWFFNRITLGPDYCLSVACQHEEPELNCRILAPTGG